MSCRSSSLAVILCLLASGSISDAQDVVIHELAWMGTTYSTSDEWIELHNAGDSAVDLAGWSLVAADGTPTIPLAGSIEAGGYFLLERTDDGSVPGVPADQIYTGALENTGEVLELRDGASGLIDGVDAWHAGDNTLKATMSRVPGAADGNDPASWFTSTTPYDGGYGSPKAPNPLPQHGGDWFEVYFSRHLRTRIPGATGPRAAAQALIEAIDAAQDRVLFALYGVDGSPAVIDALVRAVDRGLDVRGVVDAYDRDPYPCDNSPRYPYRGTQQLIDALPPGAVVDDDDDRLMHNKFFVFDDEKVWTGSANVSAPGLYLEYNSNVSILIEHPGLAQAYATELEEMFAGDFHTDKTDNTTHVFPPLADGSLIESRFAPTDDARGEIILRAIGEADATLDARIFYLTDDAIRDALVAAAARGVAVRVIADAASAEGEFSEHQALRDAGIPAKVENWPGKEHMKALVADGEVVVLGSQNWTGSGNDANDENTLYVVNTVLGAEFSADFEHHWLSIPDIWLTADPGAESVDSEGTLTDFFDNDHDGVVDEGCPQELATIETGPGAINVYFNKSVLAACAESAVANSNVDLLERLLARIEGATQSLDVATYELNLLPLADALVAKAAAGVDVRVIADAKEEDPDRQERYDLYAMVLEILKRGADGTVGSSDDVSLFSESPIFAVTDADKRTAMGLPPVPDDLPWVTVEVATQTVSGYLLADAEYKDVSGVPTAGHYLSPSPQMHNKFVILDRTWVWTGSWNFTVTGLYGDEQNMADGVLGGNTNHAVELHSPELAAIYTAEFEEMWGGPGLEPDPAASNFGGRKCDNTGHQVTVGGREIEVYFSPGRGDPPATLPDDMMARLVGFVAQEADESARFSATPASPTSSCRSSRPVTIRPAASSTASPGRSSRTDLSPGTQRLGLVRCRSDAAALDGTPPAARWGRFPAPAAGGSGTVPAVSPSACRQHQAVSHGMLPDGSSSSSTRRGLIPPGTGGPGGVLHGSILLHPRWASRPMRGPVRSSTTAG